MVSIEFHFSSSNLVFGTASRLSKCTISGPPGSCYYCYCCSSSRTFLPLSPVPNPRSEQGLASTSSRLATPFAAPVAAHVVTLNGPKRFRDGSRGKKSIFENSVFLSPITTLIKLRCITTSSKLRRSYTGLLADLDLWSLMWQRFCGDKCWQWARPHSRGISGPQPFKTGKIL